MSLPPIEAAPGTAQILAAPGAVRNLGAEAHPGPRVAWFSPMPPSSSGIAAYSAELLPWLRARGLQVDVFAEPPGGLGVAAEGPAQRLAPGATDARE
ncbi:MAG: hypothetical protein R2712_00130, partial [Vicinamibacterales bacterium]